jgi:hypothetical protein
LQNPWPIYQAGFIHRIIAEPIILRLVAIVLGSPKEQVDSHEDAGAKMTDEQDITAKHKKDKEDS